MAHITCSAEEVKLAAEAVIAHILDARKKTDEATITEVMTKKHFWSRKPFTHEDATKWLYMRCDLIGWRSIYAWKDLEAAKNLLLLAKHGDPVVVDAESAKVLWG